jgi:hypothetical protein
MMPVAWTHSFTGTSGAGRSGGKTSRVFTTTMGSSVDLASEGLRRLVVNAAYWCLGLEATIPAASNVDFVGDYTPTPFGHGKHKTGVKPTHHAM